MAPRSILTHHHKSHILRQFSGRPATSARDLADRYGVSKAALANILEARNTNTTSSSDITFDFLKTTCSNLEVKEETVSFEKEVEVSLKKKGDASLAQEKLESEEKEEDKEVKKEPVSLVEEETGIPTVHEKDTKTPAEDSNLTERLKKISLHHSQPLSPPGKVLSEGRDEHNPSRQELFTALLTLQQVVGSHSMPRWFTFVFDSIFPTSNPEDVWSEVQWVERRELSLPPRQDMLSALLVLRKAMQSNRHLPAWFSFTLSRVLQKYRSTRRHASRVSKLNSTQDSVRTSPFMRTWY